MATAENTAAASYTTTTTQAMVDDSRVVTHYTGWTLETGGNDMTTFDATGTLANRTIDSAGQTLTIPATELIITENEIAYDTNGAEIGRVSAAMAERGVRGYIVGGLWIQAHYGNPGANRTANILALGRVQFAESGWTVAQ